MVEPSADSALERAVNRLAPVAGRAVRKVSGTRQRLFSLEARVRELEAAVEENRRLNVRVAELTDLVAETLLPPEHRDDARLRDALERFLRES